jgi:hypothetical protein
MSKHTYWYTIADDDADPPRRWPITLPYEYDLTDQNDVREIAGAIADPWDIGPENESIDVHLYGSEHGPIAATVAIYLVTMPSYHAGRVVMAQQEASE